MARKYNSKMEAKLTTGLFITLFIFFVSIAFLPELMTFVSTDYKPSDSPPWYFIIEDFRLGIAASIGLVVSLIFVFFYFNKTDDFYYFLIFGSIMWYGNYIGNALFIFLNTTNIFNSELAQTTWQTQVQYLNNPWKSYLFYLLLVISLIGFIFLRRKNADSN